MELSNECELGNFSITEECDCEHCRNLPPFSVTWSNGGTWYCLSCAQYDEDFEITDEFKEKLLKIQKEKAKEYYTKELNDIEKQTEIF